MTNRAVIGLGSNIEPDENIQKAKDELTKAFSVISESKFKQTKPVGPIMQADFINGTVLIETESDIEPLKAALNQMESDLGRRESRERFGPRTIDLDIVVFNSSIVDQDFYSRDYLKESVLELLPDLEY